MTGECAVDYPGKLVEIRIDQFMNYLYYKNDYEVNTTPLSFNHTYISIFGPMQNRALTAFLSDSRIKIIYEAKKAVNRREGYGESPRNTLFVWEFSPDTAQNAAP